MSTKRWSSILAALRGACSALLYGDDRECGPPSARRRRELLFDRQLR